MEASLKAFALLCALLVALALGVPAAAGASRNHSRSSARAVLDKRRAIAAYNAMQRAYYIRGAGLYKGNPYSDAWPYAHALAATISVAALPRMHARHRPDLIARLRGLEAYADHVDPPPAGFLSQVSPPRGPGGARFNDDNEWIGIELLRLYHVDHLPSLIRRARQIFSMVSSQWDLAPNVACPGGVPFRDLRVNGDRNTVSNAPGAELGTQLYTTTHQPAYLSRAERMYEWVRGCLLRPGGLYADHIDGEGVVDPTEWTYNQGTMIGAGVMLYRATHDRVYIQQAEGTARAALRAFGPVQLAQQPTTFDAIYFRNLLLLGGTSGDPRYKRAAQRYADDAWANVRAANGLFMSGPSGTTQLLDQAAMVQVYALLAEPPSAYF